MPSLQTVNLRRDDPDVPDPTGVEKFFSSIGTAYKDRQDKAEIDSIISGYQQNRQDENALEDLFLNISKSNASPTRQIEAIGKIKEGQQIVTAREKALSDRAERIAKANAPPKKTQSSQPIDPEQLENIQRVRQMPEYPNASPSRKYQMLTDNNVSRENAEAEAKIYSEESKNAPGVEFAKGREKQVLDYVGNSIEKYNQALEMQHVLSDVDRAISGEVEGEGLMAAVKNNPIGQLLVGLTPDEATLVAANKKLLGGTKSIFGSKPTEREIFLLLNSMLPSVGKSPQANRASYELLKKYNDLELMHGEIVDELTEGGTKYVDNLEQQVRERMKPIGEMFLKEVREEKSRQEQQAKQSQNQQQSRYRAPDGTIYLMTPEQVENAKKDNVIFEPV